MASRLTLPFDASVPNDARKAVFRWMRSRDGWLLVLDNVDDPESVSDFMPSSDVRGHIVVTTRANPERLRRCGVLRSRRDEHVVLECLDATTSILLLCRLCARDVESLSDGERVAAHELCIDELGGLPLAIEQAGSYMRGHGVGFVDYVALFRAQWRQLFGVEARMSAAGLAMEWQNWIRSRGIHDATIDALREYGVRTLDDLRALSENREDCDGAVSSLSRMEQTKLWRALNSGDGVPVAEDRARRSVRTTWELSMRSLTRGHKEMVWLLCNFGGDDIPADAVVSCVAELPPANDLRQLMLGMPRDDAAIPLLVAMSACSDVLRDLSERSLVKWLPSASLASMHRLLQSVVWESSPTDAREPVAGACLTGLASGLLPLMSSVRSEGLASDAATTVRLWLPHADAVRRKRSDVCSSHPTLVPALVRLVDAAACGFELLAQFERACKLYRVALELKHGLYGADADHPAVATALSGLAGVLEAQGDLAESARLQRESLAMLRRLHGADADHSAVAASLSNLANVLEAQGALTESAVLHRESLAMERRLHGDDAAHPAVAASLSNLASVVEAQGDVEQAARLHRESLAMKRRLHGADHPEVAASLTNLAGVLEAQGDLTESCRLHRESLAMKRRLHGTDADHPSIAASLTNLANVLHAQGASTESARLYRESLAMLRRLHGANADHPSVAMVLSNLASVMEAGGDVAECSRLHREALTMLRRLHGEGGDHPSVATSLNNLARVLEAQGELTESAQLHRESLVMKRRLHGEGVDHPSVASSLSNLALVLEAQGDLDESAALHRDALAMERRLHGPDADHPSVATSLSNVASVLYAQGDLDEAARLYREALAMLSRLHGVSADHPVIAAVLSNLAEVLEGHDDLSEAARLHRESLAMQQRLYDNADHPDIAASLESLANVLLALGQRKESVTLIHRCVGMKQRLGIASDEEIDFLAELESKQ